MYTKYKYLLRYLSYLPPTSPYACYLGEKTTGAPQNQRSSGHSTSDGDFVMCSVILLLRLYL